MSDRRRRRRRSDRTDRPEYEPRPDREPWAEREPRADREPSSEREPRADREDEYASESEEPAGDEDVADALEEYERRRNELFQARRRDRADRSERADDRSDRDRFDGDERLHEDDDDSSGNDVGAWGDRESSSRNSSRRGGTPRPNPRPGVGTPRPSPMPNPNPMPNPQPRSGSGEGVGTGSGSGWGSGRGAADGAAVGASVQLAGTSRGGRAGRAYSLDTPREVRRDGLFAWVTRGYRRFRRNLRQNLTAYGHRYNSVGPNAATDSKPLLLWLVDLPRLICMWIGHVDYRTTRAATLAIRDFRSRGPRIPFRAAEVYSPLVASRRPTSADLYPFWRWPGVRDWTREFRSDWRNALSLVAAGAGAAVAGAKEELNAELSAVGDRAGRSLAWTQAQATRFDRLFRPTGRHDDRAWWFACGTGLCGLALTSLLFLQGEPALAEANRAAAAAPNKSIAGLVPDAGLEPDDPDFHAAPDQLFGGEDDPLQDEDEPFGGEPDPNLIARADSEPGLESDEAIFGGHENPFSDMGDFAVEPTPDAYVRPLPALTIEMRRAEPDLPDDFPSYEPPDDETIVERSAAPVRTPLPSDPGGWDQERRRTAPAAAVLPAEYIGVPRNESIEPAPFEPAPFGGEGLNDASFGGGEFIDDGFGENLDGDFGAAVGPVGGPPSGATATASDVPADGVPAAAGAGLTVTRSAMDSAALGTAYTYDLWVKNDGDAPASAVLEEVVGPGVRVTNAVPPAEFQSAGGAADQTGPGRPGGGTLTWDLPVLPPGAVRQLSVTVHPLPPAADAEAGGEIAFTTDARVTGRWAVAGVTLVAAAAPAEPEPLPEPERDFPAAPDETWDRDWPSDPPPVNDFDFPDEPSLIDEPEPAWDPEIDWEPRPLPDPEVMPTQMIAPEQIEPELDPDPVFETDPVMEPELDFDSEPIMDPEPLDEEPTAAPRLRITLAGPRGVRAGDDVRFVVTVSNEGSGAAEAVTIACPVPERLRHPGGKRVRCLLGELSPGEVRTASFIARAVAPGSARPELTVTARGGLIAAVTSPLTVRPKSRVVCP
ncbi:hypothetical protein [Alienimonas chondri]|uniref:DUF11 domain-containing protein n=1 Tax=Alienimonas chondri TaxID=2681879 RepID=A0ABX1VI57_9PLAN|nr:hypothetical protein [Alienimonas chondri]NNJ27760.1 hypothetical protein [Alienimonas chondri]